MKLIFPKEIRYILIDTKKKLVCQVLGYCGGDSTWGKNNPKLFKSKRGGLTKYPPKLIKQAYKLGFKFPGLFYNESKKSLEEWWAEEGVVFKEVEVSYKIK